MECEIVIKKHRVRAEEGLILDYTLSKRKNGNGLFLYSLMIEEQFEERCEFVFLEDLTLDEAEAIDLFLLFAEESVTPCTAEDILHEIFFAP